MVSFLLSKYINNYLILILLCIAIIGGGIGGTSCAYFLKEIFKKSVNIDIYEGNKVGGRLATVFMEDDSEYEVGGSIIHQRNKYMSDFVHNLGELMIHLFLELFIFVVL